MSFYAGFRKPAETEPSKKAQTTMQIYVMIDGNRHGPYSPEEVRQYLATGQLQPQMPAWCEGKTDWQPLETFPEFAPAAAKPGRKPGRSRTALYASLAVGAVALCAVAGWLVWHGKQSNGSETATGANPAAGTPDLFASHPDWPKTLAELNKWYAEPPAGQNAAEVFRQGYDAMKEQISANNKNENLPVMGTAITPLPGSPVPAAMKKAIADYMQQTKTAWDFFQQGSHLTQSRYPIDFTQGANLLIPDLARVKQGAQTAVLYAIGFADTQRGQEAGESVLIGYAIGRSLEAEPLLISQLVRAACNAISLKSLQQTVNRVALPPQILTQLQDVLGRMADREASGESFNRAFVEEMLDGLHYFDMSPEKFQKTLDSFGTNLPNDTNGLISTLQKNGLKNAKADRQFFVATWDQVFAARKEPFPSRLKADDFFVLRATEAAKQQYLITAMMAPSLAKSTLVEARSLAWLRLAQAAVALEQFRAAGGNRYPDNLAELSPKFLAAVPEDPFDGQPLRYAKSGNGYTLYSIGLPGASEANLKGLTFTVFDPPKPASAAP
jgi:hypothetical protein